MLFIIIGVSATEMGEDYLRTKRDVNILVDQINLKFPNSIVFQEKSEAEMKLFQRLTLFYITDVLIVGGVRYFTFLFSIVFILIFIFDILKLLLI